MNSELEKKMLQKLKESLEKPKEDAFESNDVVDNLKDEFKHEEFIEKDSSSRQVSGEELSEDDLENELIDEDYKKGEEEFLESETVATPEEKLSAAPAPLAAAQPAPIVQEIQKPAANIIKEQPVKKKSRIGLIFFLLLLFAGVIAVALYFLL